MPLHRMPRLNTLRRALSQRGFEIMRECDLGSRIRQRGRGTTLQCRILYVIEPDLFATALSIHSSAALWLPIPVVLCGGEEFVIILPGGSNRSRPHSAFGLACAGRAIVSGLNGTCGECRCF
jgi:hypothetical protein